MKIYIQIDSSTSVSHVVSKNASYWVKHSGNGSSVYSSEKATKLFNEELNLIYWKGNTYILIMFSFASVFELEYV